MTESGSLRNSFHSGNALTCSFCPETRTETGPLFHGPYGKAICAECLEFCESVLAQEKQRRGGRTERPALATTDAGQASRTAHCSFCGANYRDCGPIIEGPGAGFLCDSCCAKGVKQLAPIRRGAAQQVESGRPEAADANEPHGVFRASFLSLFIIYALILAIALVAINVVSQKIPKINLLNLDEIAWCIIAISAASVIFAMTILLKFPVCVTPLGITCLGPADVSQAVPWTEIAFIYKNNFLLMDHIYIVRNDGRHNYFPLVIYQKELFLSQLKFYIKMYNIKSAPEEIG